jgi:parallel beta-helix repeat protein
VAIIEEGNPTLRSNRINRNDYVAIWIYKGGAGVIEDNDLHDNASGAWLISEDSKTKVKRARNLE